MNGVHMRLDENFFDQLIAILESMGKGHYKNVILSEKKAYLSPEIRIGMWGQFSCGKSSFINALIGKKLLPVNILELTSMVSEVAYGDKEMIILNPDHEKISFDYSAELAAIAMAGIKEWDELKPSMKESLDEGKFATSLADFNKLESPLLKVRLETPSDILKSGLIFVDLPGLSGTDDHSKLSSGRINECEMVLYLNAPSRPIDKHDWDIIKKLKCDSKNRVIFGVRTKSDDLFKIHYAENPTAMSDEKRYELFLKEFKQEIQEVPFDEYLLVSPLAISAISDCHGNFQEAMNFLKEQHKNKFRFLNEDSKIEVISGYKMFIENFGRIVDTKREEAKVRKVRSTIQNLLASISHDIQKEWEVVTSNKSIDEKERIRLQSNLERIRAKFEPLKVVGSRFDNLIDFQLRDFMNSVTLNCMKAALYKLDLDINYRSPEHVVEVITQLFQRELFTFMGEPQFHQRFQQISKSALDEYRDSLCNIDDLLDKFSKELVQEEGSTSGAKNLEFMKGMNFSFNLNGELSQLNNDGQLGGIAGGLLGAFLIDTTMNAVLESICGAFAGFGLGTIVIGAFRGMSQGKSAAQGIYEGFANLWDGLWSMLGGQDNKARLLTRKLGSNQGKDEFARNLANQIGPAMHAGVKKTIVDQVTSALEKQNTIELIMKRFQTEEKKLATLYSNKDRDLKQRQKDIEKLIEQEKAFGIHLQKYGLAEVKIKEAV
jgi:Dynamin family